MSRFKTELCNNLIELGNCKYGDRCHYAHGAHELRQVSRRHPKYRTEKCKNFEMTGKCPFGPRCSYVHPKPDFDSMIDQLSKYMQYTKAPKPDSEDEPMIQQHHQQSSSLYGSSSNVASSDFNQNGSETDISSLPFTRTNTNTSLSMSSTCGSISAINNHNNEDNKENQLVSHYHSSVTAAASAAFHDKRTSSFISNGYTIDNPFAIKRPFCQPRDFNSTVSPAKLQAATQLATTTATNSIPSTSSSSFKANTSAADSLFSFNNNPPLKQQNEHKQRAAISSSSSANSIPRTPLGNSNTFSNILINPTTNNKSNLTNLYAPTKPSSVDALMVDDTGLASKAHANAAYNTSSFAFGSTSYECAKKSSHLILASSSSSSSNSNNAASDPFGINNPFSDYINNSNLNRRSPLQPNKQYYTRF